MEEKNNTHPRFFPIKDLYVYIQSLVQRKLWLKVLIAMALGVALGSYFATHPAWIPEHILKAVINWISLPGNLFIRAVQMIMIPLMFSSIIMGIAGGENKEYLLKSGPKVLIYFGITSVVTLTAAVIIATLMHPGSYMDASLLITEDMKLNTDEVQAASTNVSFGNLPAILIHLIPANPLQSMVSGDMLSIVIFGIIIGIALINIPKNAAIPLLNVIFSIQEITMAITKWAMKIAPLAVFGLLCQVTSQVGIETILGLSMFMLTVVIGLLLTVLLYIIILKIYTGISIRKFFKDAKDVLLLAFSVSSSAAVMPLTLKTAEEKMNINPSVSKFVIPIGITVNMDGTAVFQAIATIFLAQVYGLELSVPSILVVIVTTIMASIGTPSAPGAGVIVLGTVLSSIGIPVTAIALIIGVDRLLGMLRSTINVMGDLVACHVFDKMERNKLTE